MDADVKIITEWFKAIPSEQKNHIIFRWERMQDPAYKDLYDVLKTAEKLHRSEKKSQKQERKK